jgi:hypothetical protein
MLCRALTEPKTAASYPADFLTEYRMFYLRLLVDCCVYLVTLLITIITTLFLQKSYISFPLKMLKVSVLN